jgi:hypothetical protein
MARLPGQAEEPNQKGTSEMAELPDFGIAELNRE